MTANNPAFVSIKGFCKLSGLSQFYIRQRVRAGSLPFIRSGTTYLINASAALEVLDAESREGLESERQKD